MSTCLDNHRLEIAAEDFQLLPQQQPSLLAVLLSSALYSLENPPQSFVWRGSLLQLPPPHKQ